MAIAIWDKITIPQAERNTTIILLHIGRTKELRKISISDFLSSIKKSNKRIEKRRTKSRLLDKAKHYHRTVPV